MIERIADPLAIALDLIARNIKSVPVPFAKKNPVIPVWQHLDITTANAAQYFNGASLNVGAIMGPRSGGLCDVDLDCPEAVKLAKYFLPETHSIYGRPGKRRSHWLYTCPDPDPKACIRLKDEDGKTIAELRLGGGGKGCQSVMPGSLHPSGEHYEWDEDGERNSYTCGIFKDAHVKLCAAVLLTRHWPEQNRHDAALTVGGFLSRTGWDRDAIGHFIVAVQEGAGVDDNSHVENGRAAAQAAADLHAEGGPVYDLPQMIEVFGENAAKQIAKIVGYRGSESRTSEEGFEVDAGGRKVAKSQRNVRKAMELLGVTVSYDMFHDRMLIAGLDGHSIVSDAATEKLWLDIDEQFRFLPSIEFFRTVVSETARRNSFHPVREYLDTLTWDGTERIDSWLITYAGAADTPYVRAVGAITLVAAVRRIRHPGCKFDEMLILESPQGKDKSTMLTIMAVRPDWFSDDLPLNANSQKVIEQLQGKWIIEAAEMSGLRKTDVEHVKTLLSRQSDRSRLAYGRFTIEQPRQSIVVGTTNSSIYLKDLTGNRRFWPVKVGEIKLNELKRDRDQLWAEAAAREASG